MDIEISLSNKSKKIRIKIKGFLEYLILKILFFSNIVY